MYRCPDCKQPLTPIKTGNTRRYTCNTPSCEVVYCRPAYTGTGFREVKRVAVPRASPLTWLTVDDVLRHPTILEMKELE